MPITLSRRAALLAAPLLRAKRATRLAGPPDQNYLIFTSAYEIRLRIEYFDRYTSNGFQFKDHFGNTSFCLGLDGARNHNCLGGFTGSLALVRFEITRSGKEINGSFHLREHVRMIDRHERLPERAPYDQAIEAPSGVGTDIQAFGYEPGPQAASVAGEDDVWCLFRQDLYFGSDDKPFATLHWKHTLANLRLLDLIPGAGTRLE